MNLLMDRYSGLVYSNNLVASLFFIKSHIGEEYNNMREILVNSLKFYKNIKYDEYMMPYEYNATHDPHLSILL